MAGIISERRDTSIRYDVDEFDEEAMDDLVRLLGGRGAISGWNGRWRRGGVGRGRIWVFLIGHR